MRPDPSKLGANVGFGYLTDDDDDDAAGGAGADAFEALVNASLVSTADVGDTVSFQIDAITGSGAQTSGSVRVSVSGVDLTGAPTTVGLAGWSESGWSLSSGEWFNTLTKASLSVGTTSPTFSCVPDEAGTLTITTNYGGTHAPHTAEATGAGNSRSVTIDTEYTLTITPGTTDPTATHSGAFEVLVEVVATPAQTNGQFALRIGPNGEDDNVVVNTIEDEDLDGWTNVFGWTIDANYRTAVFTKAAPSGTDNLTFRGTTGSLSAGYSFTVTVNAGTVGGVAGSGIPGTTDQATAPDSTPVTVPIT